MAVYELLDKTKYDWDDVQYDPPAMVGDWFRFWHWVDPT